jgi:hypothetical protein
MLKPKKCPKCNSKPELMQTFDCVCGSTKMFFVECERCRIRTFSHLTKKKAVESWNGEKEIITEGGVFK